MPDSSRPMTFNRIAALIAMGVERYVLSWVYLYFALVEVDQIQGIYSGQIAIETTTRIDVAHHVILLVLSLFTCLMLFAARRAAVPPQGLKFILIPLATTFFNLAYFAIPHFPASLQINLCPPDFQKSLLLAGLACIITGQAIALWGILYLGRSFGIFVTVRKVVLTGPYQWIRHPMYLGWVWFCIGIAIANCSIAYFLLVAMHISLLFYRAHLEETQLAEHSAEYRENMKRTGFIFPKFRRPSVRLQKAE